SPEFYGDDASRAKVKKPFEFVASAVRALGAAVDAQAAFGLARASAEIGEPLYQAQPPTGYPDRAEAWVTSGALLARMNFALALASGRYPRVTVDPGALVAGADPRSPDAVLDRLLAVLVAGQTSAETRAVLAAQLTNPEITRLSPDARARPTSALKPPKRGEGARALDLDGFYAMHPALAPLVPLWENRSLAVVHACGSPDTTRSHFDAQDYMESGTPGVKATPDGWLARAVKTLPAKPAPFRAVALGRALPRALQGDAGAIAMQSIDRFDMRTADTTARGGFEALYARSVSDVLSGTGYQTFEAMKMLQSANASRIPPANGAEYPRGQFGEAMRQVAQLIKANVGLEVAFADTQGWDTHVGQAAEQGQLAARLRDVAGALAAFAQDLGDRMAEVVVLTMSEFGRTIGENGNR